MSNADREGAVKQPFKGPFTKKQCGHHLPFWAVFDADGHGVSPDFVNPDDAQWLCDTLNRSIPTTPPAAEAGEREAFEAAYNRDWRGSAIGIFRERNGEYAYEKWEHAWWAWQARTSLLPTPSYQDGVEAALAAQPATAEDPNESTYQRGRFDGIMEYAAAILALTPSTAGKETT